MLSAMENGAILYSPSWSSVKYSPRAIVRSIACLAFVRLPVIKEWWAQVTVTPEAKSTMVLSSGTE